jgi:nucleotide-binding universal stress UspA family protein
MQKILVPCDFSEPSIQGLRFAVEVATVNAAELVVLSVIDPRQQENEPFVSERFKKVLKSSRVRFPSLFRFRSKSEQASL